MAITERREREDVLGRPSAPLTGVDTAAEVDRGVGIAVGAGGGSISERLAAGEVAAEDELEIGGSV